MNNDEKLTLYPKSFILLFSVFFPGIIGNLLIYSNLKRLEQKKYPVVVSAIFYHITLFNLFLIISFNTIGSEPSLKFLIIPVVYLLFNFFFSYFNIKLCMTKHMPKLYYKRLFTPFTITIISLFIVPSLIILSVIIYKYGLAILFIGFLSKMGQMM